MGPTPNPSGRRPVTLWTDAGMGRMTDGDYPNGLTMNGEGHLYGTTRGGGKYGYGVVFEITP